MMQPSRKGVAVLLKSEYTSQHCSIARALEAVGERWTLLIVRELLYKPRRFSQLERRLMISKNILATRLDKLIELEVVEMSAVDDPRDWNMYNLTRKGEALFPVVSALMAWGDHYYAPDGPPAVFTHSCGSPAGHKLVCEACAGVVDAESIVPVPGPGFVR